MTSTQDPFAFPACLTRFTGPQDHAPDPVYLALLAAHALVVPTASTEDAAIGGNVIAFRPRRPAPGKPL
jgi:hypothetical protein